MEGYHNREQIADFAARHMWTMKDVEKAMKIEWCVDECSKRDQFTQKLLQVNLDDMKIMVTNCI